MDSCRALQIIDGVKTDLPVTTSANWDWKESADDVVKETIDAINLLLEKRNLHIKIHAAVDPMLAGSDTYGFLFSTRKLSKKQARKISKSEWGM